MPQIVFPLIIFVVIPTIWFIATYNKFIKLKNLIEEKWSSIDVALKRRHNLIPNLIGATKGYSRHESEVLENTSKIRTEDESVSSRQKDESLVSRSLLGLIATAEAYPDLKASNNFLALALRAAPQFTKTSSGVPGTLTLFNTFIPA